MAKKSKRVKSEAGKAMHSKNKVTRSLAGKVLRQDYSQEWSLTIRPAR